MTNNANSKILKLEIKIIKHDKTNNKLKIILVQILIFFFIENRKIKYKHAMKVEASKYLKILSS